MQLGLRVWIYPIQLEHSKSCQMHALHVMTGAHLDDGAGLAGGLQEALGDVLIQWHLACTSQHPCKEGDHATQQHAHCASINSVLFFLHITSAS